VRRTNWIALSILFFFICSACTTTKNITIRASEPDAELVVNGTPIGKGKINYIVTKKPITVDIDYSEYEHIEQSIIPKKVNHPFNTAFGVIMVALGIGGGAAIAMMPNDNTTSATKNDDNSGQIGFGIIVGLLFGGTGVSLLTPDIKWEDSYAIDMNSYSYNDKEGYNKKTGFNRFGVNKAGQFLDGSSFSGRIVDGIKAGYGVCATTDGKAIKGNFVNNEVDGFAFVTYPDTSIFAGSFSAGKEDGVGVMIDKKGSRTRQVWKEGVLVSQTSSLYKIISKSGKDWIFLGDQGRGTFADGQGDAVTIDGKNWIKNGQFKNGILVQGTTVGQDGNTFTGTYEEGVPTKGRVAYPDGSTFDGIFQNGLPVGKGTLVAADGTTYVGDFKNGKYDGEGKISRKNGESYEGTFVDGKPHGNGIYFNGETVERCEYYQGKRIDQAYQIRQENEKQLAAIRAEREKIAKEKADQAERQRLADERQAADVAAANQRSSDNLLGSLLVGGFAAGLSGAVGLDAGTALSLGASAAVDTYKGDSNMTTMNSTGQAILDSKGASDANGDGTGSSGPKMVNRSSVSQTFLSQRPNRLLEAKFKGWEGHKDNDYQYYSFCATADLYYKQFFAAAQRGKSEQECALIYQQHLNAVGIAEQMMATWDGSPTLKTAPSPKLGTKEAEDSRKGSSNPGAVWGGI
jgi:hypothetical protein